MPRSSGTYTLPAGNPVVTGTTITSTWANTTLSDIATALTNSVPTDGSAPMVGALQMGNNKITGVTDGTASSDVATVNQISNPTITGGTIDGAPIGAANPKNGAFLALSATSASLTGTCTAPTVTPSTDSSTKIATTAFVQSAITAVSSGVTSFNTRSGAVTLSSGDVTTALGYTPYNASGTTVVTTSNISSYAPTVSGSGAYGTWGISISGNAATATTATNLSGGTVSASSISSSGNITAYSGTSYAALQPASVSLYNGTTGMYCDGSVFGWQFSGTTRGQLTSGGANYNTTGTYAAFSDSRIKQNIVNAPNYLDKLCALNVVNFNYIDNQNKMLGFIAQDVEKIMPGLVEIVENKNYPNITDLKGIKLTVLIPMLVQAIQELKSGLDTANAEIAALKG